MMVMAIHAYEGVWDGIRVHVQIWDEDDAGHRAPVVARVSHSSIGDDTPERALQRAVIAALRAPE